MKGQFIVRGYRSSLGCCQARDAVIGFNNASRTSRSRSTETSARNAVEKRREVATGSDAEIEVAVCIFVELKTFGDQIPAFFHARVTSKT